MDDIFLKNYKKYLQHDNLENLNNVYFLLDKRFFGMLMCDRIMNGTNNLRVCFKVMFLW